MLADLEGLAFAAGEAPGCMRQQIAMQLLSAFLLAHFLNATARTVHDGADPTPSRDA